MKANVQHGGMLMMKRGANHERYPSITAFLGHETNHVVVKKIVFVRQQELCLEVHLGWNKKMILGIGSVGFLKRLESEISADFRVLIRNRNSRFVLCQDRFSQRHLMGLLSVISQERAVALEETAPAHPAVFQPLPAHSPPQLESQNLEQDMDPLFPVVHMV